MNIDSITNGASITNAILMMAQDLQDGHSGNFSANVLARAPGDNAKNIIRNTVRELGIGTVEIYVPTANGETLLQVINDAVLEVCKTVIVLLDDAHNAEPEVLREIASQIAREFKGKPCFILAVTSTAGENKVASSLAEGLKWDKNDIRMFRTQSENMRMVEDYLNTFST